MDHTKTAVLRGMGWIASVDQAILLRIHRWHRPWQVRLMRALTHLGNTESWIFLGLALFATGGSATHGAYRLGCSALFATVLTQILKRTCRRARPSCGIRVGFTALVENPDAFSFPSGHTAAAFGVAVALAGQGHGLGALFLVLAPGIGLSRVYLGAHYPLDVVAGAMLGMCAGLCARLVVG